jgi:hypothetical protein
MALRGQTGPDEGSAHARGGAVCTSNGFRPRGARRPLLWFAPLVGRADVRISHTLDMDRSFRIHVTRPLDRLALGRLHGACSFGAPASDGVVAFVTTLDVKVALIFSHACSLSLFAVAKGRPPIAQMVALCYHCVKWGKRRPTRPS